MNRQTITPASEDEWLALRCQDITSTDVAALFGMSPYKTEFELWHEKRSGERAPFVENERMRWGNRLEASIARGIAEDRDWCVRPFKEYVRLPDQRIGSSFDYRKLANGHNAWSEGDQPGRVVLHVSQESDDDCILEIKTVDWLAFKNGWTVEADFIEAPAHIELQVQHQMLVSGLDMAYIGVLVGGNDVRIIEREADAAVHRAILQRVAAFWASVDANEAPDPVMPDDAAAVIRMHQFAEPGKLVDLRGDANLVAMLAEYRRLKAEAADLSEQVDAIKAQILQHIGDAEKVIADGFKISAGMVGEAQIAFTRKPYRNLRITEVKPK